MAQAVPPETSFSLCRELLGRACGFNHLHETPQLCVDHCSPGTMADAPVAVSMDVPMFLGAGGLGGFACSDSSMSEAHVLET